MTYVERLNKSIRRLALSNCMFDRKTNIIEAYENLLKRVHESNFRPNAKDKLLWKIYAIKCNCSDELYLKLSKIDEQYDK